MSGRHLPARRTRGHSQSRQSALTYVKGTLLRTRSITSVLLCALAIASLTGCAPDAAPEENTASACAALEQLNSAVEAAKSDLSSAETMGDLRDIRESVSEAYTEAESALDRVAADRADQLAESWSALSEEVEGVSDDAAIADARESLIEEFRELGQARQDAQSDLECD